MILRKSFACLTLIGILSSVHADGDRWSRQIANSEWIPLADPRSNQRSPNPSPSPSPTSAPVADSAVQAAGQVPALSLPPALQQQYQDQLLQLQKTQESIQRLLLLQQQLKAQQQILQSHAYQPNSFANIPNDKQALHQSTIVNLQTIPELAPEVLVPPVPSSEALPPVFQQQDFHSTESNLKHDHNRQPIATNLPLSSEQDYRQSQEDSVIRGTSHSQEESEKDYRIRQKTRYDNTQGHKEEPNHINFVTPATSSAQDSSEQEEVQLVYVPAETLAQHGQNKLHRTQSRKYPSNRHHQHHGEFSSTALPSHDAYAREILQQIQRQHEEKNQYFNSERQKELSRLQAEQKELDRQTRIHHELVRKDLELKRQREAEKKRKELEKIEEAARQRELQRIQELREKERQDERNMAALKEKQEEERSREIERLAEFEKEKELRRQKEYEQSNQQETRTRIESIHNHGSEEIPPNSYEIEHSQAQPFLKGSQLNHQHLTEVTSKNLKDSRSRSTPRNKFHHYNQQQHQPQFQDSSEVQPTTPSPNQPPLSVYMGDSVSDHSRVQLTDVLRTLKNARTIAVLDSFGPETPRVFVGPRNLDAPVGYAKFDLPYLSSIENNRVERKVDKLPFFVAPLSFDPPPGYSKIPFPAPHIGSVVVNAIENIETKSLENQNPKPNPLIEPNSYLVSDEPFSRFDISTPSSYSQEPSTPRYEVSSFPPSPSSTKWRFREFYETKPSTAIPSAVTAASYNEERTPTNKFERPSKYKNYYNSNEVSTTAKYYSPKTVTAFAYEQITPQSTPTYHEEPARHHSIESHLVSQNIDHRQPVVNRYHSSEGQQQAHQRYPVDPTGHPVTSSYFSSPASSYEEQAQYNLPAELPAISPQLPGLVNALVEKAELASTVQQTTTPTPITTTSTTTTEASSTTYKSRTRQRGRVTAVRATSTTLSPPPARGNPERTRRPINRSRSKYTTTTEEYQDSSYDPTRRSSVTTSRYDDEERYVRKSTERPSHKSREEESKESTLNNFSHSTISTKQDLRNNNYENTPLIDTASSNGANLPLGDASVADASGSVYQRDDFPTSTAKHTERFSHAVSDLILPLSGLEYTLKSTLGPNYQSSSEQSNEQPVNGFSYKSKEDSSISQGDRDTSYFKTGKTDSILFEPISPTESPNVQRSQLQDFSPVYHHIPAQAQYERNETPRPLYRESTSSSSEEVQPIFMPISTDKQEDYEFQTTVTEVLPQATTPTTTTTEAPVIIRQRVRGRLGGRQGQQDSIIQTRPRGSQDEYVRFSAVNQDSPKTRQRTRPRTRPQQSPQHQHSPIQTNGQEYVRIQSATSQQQRRLPASLPQTTARAAEEQPSSGRGEEEYGFIRTPNYRPSQQINYNATQTQSAETADVVPSSVQTSQAQLLKNRQKYFSATRRPSTTRVTSSRSEETSYTTRPRTRVTASQSEEVKATKARPRLRRPGARRRTTTTTSTTTTESALEAHNELPLDENYPRVLPQASQDAPIRATDLTDENYPQEFLLNYGASQNTRHENYEEAQLSSELPRRQQSLSSAPSPSRLRPANGRFNANSDIYGAESQWSTKLTGSSFQPSKYTPNQPIGDGLEKALDKEVRQEKTGLMPEIITAGPEVHAITVLVSSDDNGENKDQQQELSSSSEESIMDSLMNTMVDFGKKMNATEENDSNAVTTPENQTQSSAENTSSTEDNKSVSATFKKAGLKRRRVRVRVRPASLGSEDFVTAESQSYDSSLNHLPRQSQKFRNFYVTNQPTPSTTSTTSTTTTTEASYTDKSVLEDFLDKMLGESEEVPSTFLPELISTTNIPIELANPSTIIPLEINRDEMTTLKDISSSVLTTFPDHSTDYSTISSIKDEDISNTNLPVTDSPAIDNTDIYPSTTTNQPTLSVIVSTTTQKTDQLKSSGENVIQSLNQKNSLRYFVTKSPAYNDYLRNQENKKEMSEDNPNHPKNHRSKWSEVRYPTDKSLFNFAKWNSKSLNQSGESKNNQESQKIKPESNSHTVTDYVQAIFESIKSADEEHHQTDKLVDQISSSSGKGNKESVNNEAVSNVPTEIKTSVSSSSRVVARPAAVNEGKDINTNSITTTTEAATFGPFVPSMMSDRQLKKISSETNLGKILRTTTTTKVSHMTEICYRGRCVMSKPKKEGLSR